MYKPGAAARARGRYLLFLNNDTVIPRGALRRLADAARSNPSLGLLGPRLRDGKGRIQRSARARPTVAALCHRLTLLRWTGRLLPYLLLAALAAGAIVFLVDLPTFVENAHTYAAYAMFGGIIVVAVHYACYAAIRKDRGPRTRFAFVVAYLVIAALMVVTLVVVGIFQLTGNGLGLLVVEFIVIGEFALFWLFQSIDLWELETYQVQSLSQLLAQMEESR